MTDFDGKQGGQTGAGMVYLGKQTAAGASPALQYRRVLLKIHRLAATFGRLQQETLDLGDGLNILQAPNETGKSTWCAFLAAMLYGVNSRERDRAGFIADKNRFAPWSGAAMAGRLDCRVGAEEWTLTRETKRGNAPMGEFSAVYAGTGNPVPGLTGAGCGEAILGVSREVWERSAFIRQAGLGITQDAGLERRIAALITTGEEGTSYSEAADTLKKQLNRRRHTKTGLLPETEAELAEVRGQLAELTVLGGNMAAAAEDMARLHRREAELLAELAGQDRWDAEQVQKLLEAARLAAEEAEARLGQLRSRLAAESVPENEEISRLRGAIVNLETVRRSVEKARDSRDEAMKAVLRAEAAANTGPFAGQTAEGARREAVTPPKAQAKPALPCLLAAVVLLGFCVGGYLLGQPLIAAAGLVVAAAGFGGLWVAGRGKEQRAALEKRFGTADLTAIAALADRYCADLAARDAAQADAAGKSAVADNLYATLSSNEQAILLEVRRFAPAAFDISAADEALRRCAVRRREASEAETAAREARVRYETRAGENPPIYKVGEAAIPPTRSRETVTAELETTRGALSAARTTADQLSGRMHAIGETAILQSQAAQLEAQRDALEAEYAAVALAMEVLDGANTALQSRFSPALGRRAAEIFGELTAGRYTGVVLDRHFHLSAEPAGDVIYRDAELLSAGAADQLYLASRLAICDLVLPVETGVPLILDDALANFDDARCAATLRFLKTLAASRQILLFTCHSREAAFFREDGDVSVQVLTGTANRV